MNGSAIQYFMGEKLLLHWRKVFFCLVTSVGQRKNFESPGEIEPQTFGFVLRCSTTELKGLYGERGPLRSSYMTSVLHTARISGVDNVMFVNRIRKMASFELSKEIEKDVFTSCHARKAKRGRASKRGIRRSEVRFFMGTQNCFLCSTPLTR